MKPVPDAPGNPDEPGNLDEIDQVWREASTQYDLPAGRGPRKSAGALCREYLLWLLIPALLVLALYAVLAILLANSGSGDEVKPFVYH